MRLLRSYLVDEATDLGHLLNIPQSFSTLKVQVLRICFKGLVSILLFKPSGFYRVFGKNFARILKLSLSFCIPYTFYPSYIFRWNVTA